MCNTDNEHIWDIEMYWYIIGDDRHFAWFSMWDEWDSETRGEKSISHEKPYKKYILAYFTLQGALIIVQNLR